MMNKQTTSKAGYWKVMTILPMLALLLMSFGRTGEKVPMETKTAQVQTSSILGTWKLISYNYGGGDELNPASPNSERIKFITEKNFNWVNYSATDKIVTNSAGGSYTYSGEDYTEKIEFGGQGMAGYIGKEQKFKVKIDNNKMELSGQLSNGLIIKELWKRMDSE